APVGIGDELEQTSLDLRSGPFIRLAVDHAQLKRMRSGAPVIQEARGRVDVDARCRRAPFEPAQPLERDGELTSVISGASVQHGQRVGADDAIGPESEIGLQLPNGSDDRTAVARRRRGLTWILPDGWTVKIPVRDQRSDE